MQSFVGLKSRQDEVRFKAARNLKRYVATELREVSQELTSGFLEELNHMIYDLVSSNEIHEKKGGILAIVALISLEDAHGNVARVGRFANYLRGILPCNDYLVTEMTAKAIGCLALAEGAYTAEYVEFEVRRALEWLSTDKNENKRLAAVLVLRELAVHAPTLFYTQIQAFFDNIFIAVRDSKALIREKAVSALRACLALTAQRETKEAANPIIYQQAYQEAMKGFIDTSGSSIKDRGHGISLNRDDRVHGSLLITTELFMNCILKAESVIDDYLEPVEHLPDLASLDAINEDDHMGSGSMHQNIFSQDQMPGTSTLKPYEGPKREESLHFSSRVCRNYMEMNYNEVCEAVLKYRTNRNPLIQQSLLALLPLLASFDPDVFSTSYLDVTMTYLLGCLRKDREKFSALHAVGIMALAVRNKVFPHIDPILNVIKSSLPSSRDIHAASKRVRTITVEPHVFSCISQLARALGIQLASKIDNLLDQMLSVGLSSGLTDALRVIAMHIPTLKKNIQDGVLRMLSLILMHRPLKHPGAPRGPTPLTQTMSSATVDYDNNTVALALQTLGSFDFGGNPLTQFVSSCAENYLTSEHKTIRLEAVKTCASLLVPTLQPVSILSSSHVPPSTSSAQIVSDILVQLLTVGITDPDEEVRLCVLMSLDEKYDAHLAQAENLTTLFVAMHDEAFRIREVAMCIIGRLSNLNPAFVMPSLRKSLIQILTELEYSGIGRNKEQSARLLRHMIANAPKLVKPYQEPILKVLIPKLTEAIPNPSVVINILAAIGELAKACGVEMRKYVHQLCPIIIEMLQDASSLGKREVAIWTLGQLVENTGCVIEPYNKHLNLLEVLLNLLKTEQVLSIRRETIRVIGLLGALDPYKRKLNQTKGSGSSGQGLPVSEAIHKGADSQDSNSQVDNASELLVSLSSGNLEEYYPSAAIASLMKILKDPSLSQHHTMVIQALTFIFKSLGIKSVPFLPQIMPAFLSTIRTCDPNFREFLFKQLGNIISIIKQHARKYMPDILNTVREFWSPNNPLQSTIISLIEQIVVAMGEELKVYLPPMVQPVLRVFMQDQSERKIVTQKMLNALQMCGASLDDYLHLLVPPIVKVFEDSNNHVDVRRTAMETIDRLTDTLDFSDFASQVIHAIVRVLDSSVDLRQTAMNTLCCLIVQLGSRYIIFIPMVKKVIQKNKIGNTQYDLLIGKLLQDEPLVSEDDELIHRRTKSHSSMHDDTAALETASYTAKMHVEVNSLQRAWATTGRLSKDDWVEWLRRLGVELLKESPNPALRSCWALAQAYNSLSRELFNAAFVSCWMELTPIQKEDLVVNFKQALLVPNIPEITQTLLNLAEFMEHCEESTGTLPLSNEHLGECAINCRAYAKALHYKEEEFHQGPTSKILASLISINNKLQQPDAATGVLEYARKHVQADLNVQEEWYESLHDWEAALRAYETKQYQKSGSDVNLTLGKMRCLEALGEWGKLYDLSCDSWGNVPEEDIRQKMARMATSAAWGLGEWDSMAEYASFLPRDTYMDCFFKAVLSIHRNSYKQAQMSINMARDALDNELTALVGESYNRAYGAIVQVQALSELEEIIQYKTISDRRQTIRETWWKRLQGCQRSVEEWQNILRVRSLVLTPHEDLEAWVDFSSICRKSGKMNLAHRTLCHLLKTDPSQLAPDVPLPSNLPTVTFAYIKYMWHSGKRKESFYQLNHFVESSLKPQAIMTTSDENKAKLNKLLASCYLKLGEWQTSLHDPYQEPASICTILHYYKCATEYDKQWYKAWHSLAFMNFEALLLNKQSSKQKNRPLSLGAKELTIPDKSASATAAGATASVSELTPTEYACSAVRGFFKSISLSKENSLQDTLRLLTLWFDYGHISEVSNALSDGIKTIDIDNWLQVIPQLIARIDSPRKRVSKLIHDLLTDVGKQHPQALIYPLTVASKSQSSIRRDAANAILNNMAEHSSKLVQQAIMVSEELIRVAILWHEQWHEGLEEASRLYFGEHDTKGMFGVLEPLHQMIEKGPTTLKETSFIDAYGRDLADAYEWCKKFQRTNSEKDLTQAWDLYYHVFRRISKQLPQLTTLEMQYVSPKLLNCKDLELAVPGTYEPNQPVIHIRSTTPQLSVITSKQRPRKLIIEGSNGSEFMFLLKGHEDLRQDERVMQLFGLVNTLLANDPETFKRHLRYAVIPGLFYYKDFVTKNLWPFVAEEQIIRTYDHHRANNIVNFVQSRIFFFVTPCAPLKDTHVPVTKCITVE
ncbi:serine/threonine-protein kinase mTOR-like isoform X2 [Dysidea avara]|uniref:serine/threonine-protein kinase mTOR-like isoform X2 n=1 Tax=Dysidea avara TaxID=196820 RepID=UPI00331F46BD